MPDLAAARAALADVLALKALARDDAEPLVAEKRKAEQKFARELEAFFNKQNAAIAEIVRLHAPMVVKSAIKYNENHDPHSGEFTSGGGDGSGRSEQEEVVKDYAAGGYRDLNDALRNDTPLSDKQKKMVRILDKAIADAPKLDKPVTVYRGVNFGNQGMPPAIDMIMADSQAHREDMVRKSVAAWAKNKYPAGHEFSLGGYQSTSYNIEPALDASGRKDSPGVVFEIEAKHGLKINPSKVLYDDEAELLLSRHTRYKVKSVSADKQYETSAGRIARRTVVHVEQL